MVGSPGSDHPRVLSERVRARCEAWELSGIRACVSANDERELESELLKLRAHLQQPARRERMMALGAAGPDAVPERANRTT